MGLRFRKSVKIAPGIKLNFTHKSVGISAGTKGSRVSVNSNGRVTKTFGIPGTGISYTETSNLNQLSNAASKSTKSAMNNSSNYQSNSNGSSFQNNNLFKPSNNTDILKKILRMTLYVLIPLIAIGINSNFFFPAILLESIYHLIYIRKADPAPKHKRLSTVITGFFIFLSAFGSIATYTPPAESISLTPENTTIDINETQTLGITILPEDATHFVTFKIEDTAIAKIEDSENGVYSILPLAEGSTKITAIADKVESNPITVTVIDKARIEAEKKAEEERIAAEKKAAEEEAARIAAEKKAAEEAARIAAEKKAAEEAARIAAQKKAAASAPADNSPTVYVTPTGKKYHYDNSCNGGSYSPSTLDKAISRGLTPCKKCVN